MITVSEIHDPSNAGHVAGVGRPQRWGRVGGRGGRQTRAPASYLSQHTLAGTGFSLDDADHKHGARCGHCLLMNHRTDQCRKKKSGIPAATPGRQAAISSREEADDGYFFQGNEETA
jgi:hypothetical protein